MAVEPVRELNKEPLLKKQITDQNTYRQQVEFWVVKVSVKKFKHTLLSHDLRNKILYLVVGGVARDDQVSAVHAGRRIQIVRGAQHIAAFNGVIVVLRRVADHRQ